MKTVSAFIVLFISIFAGEVINAAAPEQDCINALSVCVNTPTPHTASYAGAGLVLSEINPGSSCLASGETNDVWYIITVSSSGTLNFAIKPYNYTNIAGVIFCDDYDWAVYNITNANCSDIYSNPALEVSCNYSATQDITGTKSGGTLSSQTASGTTWNKSINVTAGQTYVLNVSNFSASQSGYSLDFSASTASIFDNIPPKILSITPQCNSKVAIKFSENILCSTVQGSDFTITGPGGPYSATITSSACLTGSKFENDFVISVSPPFSQSGNYNVALTGNVTDNCGNVSTLASSSFTVNSAIGLGNDTTLCQGQSLQLNATSPGATSYSWNTGANSPTINTTTSGSYSVSVNSGGCLMKDTINVNFTPQTAASVTAIPSANNICSGTNVSFTANPVNGGTSPSYQWYINGIAAGSNNKIFSSATLNNNDQVSVKMTSNASCVSNNPAISTAVVMNITNSQTVSVSATADKNNICPGTQVTFTAHPVNGGSLPLYQWFLNGNPVGTNSDTYSSSTLNNNDQVTVHLTSNNACVSNNPAISAPVVILLSPPAVINAGPDKTLTCLKSSVPIGPVPVPGYTYLWTPSSGLSDPTIAQPIASDAGFYSLMVTTANGCTATGTVNVTKDITPPFVDAGPNIILTCTSTSLPIGTTAVGGNSYLWTPAAGLSNASIAQPNASQPKNYTLTVTNNTNGCTVTDAVTVSQNITPPVADAGGDQTLTCSSSIVSIGTQFAGGNSYAWLPATGLSNAAIAQPKANQSNIYTLTVTNNANGCTATDAVTINQDITPPTANAGADKVITCASKSVVIGSADVAGNTYLWMPATGLNNMAIADPLASIPGNYTVTVTSNLNGCSASDAVQISIDTIAPVSDAGRDSTLTCAIKSIRLGKPAIAGNTYSWTPIAGLDYASIAQPTATEPDNFTLTVTNSRNGCQSVDNVFIRQSLTTSAAIAGGDLTLTCSAPSIQTGAPGSISDTYSWTPTKGLNDPSLAQPTVTVPGTFTLTVTNKYTGCTSDDQVTILQDTTHSPAIAGPDHTITCVAKSFAIGAAPDAGNTYSWVPSSGLNNPSISNPTVTNPGNYTLTVMHNSNGCLSTDAVKILIDTVVPVSNAGPDSTLTCIIKKIKLGKPGVSGNIYSWTPATGLDDASIAQPTTTEAYNYMLTVTNPVNGCESSDAVIIRQNLTTSQAVAGADLILTCTTSSFKIGSPGSVLNTYAWTPRSGLNDSTLAQPTVTQPGNYTLTVTNNATGCTTDDRITISQDTIPPVADAGADQTLTCVAKSVTLGTPGSGNNTYAWKPSVALSAVNIAQPVTRDTGTYYLKVTKNANGCRSWDTVAVLKDTIAPVADAGPDDSFSCPHVAMTLGTSSTPNYAYYWTRTAGLSSTDVAQPQTDLAGTFILSVINKINGCKSLPDSVVIYDKNCECTFYVPTAFSPNRDNVNDILTAFKYCDDFRDFSFSIFNRWGEEVYHTTELSEGWDGFYKNEATQDTYIWVIQYLDVLHNEKKIAKGTVVLMK